MRVSDIHVINIQCRSFGNRCKI